jgi:hypothetical protein
VALRDASGIASSAQAARRLRHAVLAAVALSAVGSTWILTRGTPLALDGDARMLLHPLLVDVARHLRDGVLPIWTVGRWGGSPLAGDPIVGALYPLYWIGYLLTPFPNWQALDVSTCLHLAILTTGIAVLMHRLDAGPLAAVTVAVLLALNPTLVYAVRGWQQYWAALSYWPWLFWACITLSSERRVWPAVVASVALAAQVYAGYPEFSLYSGLPALGWMLVTPGGARRLPLVLVIGVGAVALATPQLIPGLDMARDSLRLQELSRTTMPLLDRFFSVSPSNWWNVMRVVPPLGVASPVKLPPVAVALACVGALGRSFAPRYLLILIAVLALMATRDNPIYPIVRVVPPFTFFGAPLKLFYPLSFLLCVLAGLGVARLDALALAWRRLVVGVVGLGAALSCGTGTIATAALAALGLLTTLLPPAFLPMAVTAAACAGSLGFLAATRALDTPTPFDPPGFIELMRQRPPVVPRDGGRMLALMPSQDFSQIGLNYGSLWGIEAWNGMADLTQSRQGKVIESTTPADPVALARQIGGDPVVVGATSRQAGIFAAAGYTIVGRMGTLVFLAAPSAPAPRVALVPRAKAVTMDAAVRAARFGRALDARRVLIEADGLPGGAVGDPAGRLDGVDRVPGLVRARVELARPTWLVVREPYFRGWRATIDGRPAQIFPAGAFMMGVLVDGGSHDVRIEYRERGVPIGFAIAAIAAVVLPFAVRQVQPAA